MTTAFSRLVANDWVESAYYDHAEDESSRVLFWGADTVFFQLFSKLDLTNVLELACGHGRHYEHYARAAKTVTLVDVNIENIEFVKNRVKAPSNKTLSIMKNNGSDLSDIDSGQYTSVFSYDAMVHFEFDDVYSYLKEAFRVLVPGGQALFHHSNYQGAPGLAAHKFHDFGWRNFMSVNLFTHMASRAGLQVLSQHVITWQGIPNLDGLTLLRKSDPDAGSENVKDSPSIRL